MSTAATHRPSAQATYSSETTTLMVQAASAGAVAAATVRRVEAEHERTCWQLLVQKK